MRFPGLRMCKTVQQSMQINDLRGSAVIMASSGMCTSGRIKHHLSKHIDDAENTIVFVGYQGRGTLGRQIVDGRERVRIHGRDKVVRASVRRIDGFSAHAGRSDLLRWIGNFTPTPRQVFLTHGEEEGAGELAKRLRSELGADVQVPEYGSCHELR